MFVCSDGILHKHHTLYLGLCSGNDVRKESFCGIDRRNTKRPSPAKCPLEFVLQLELRFQMELKKVDEHLVVDLVEEEVVEV